MKSSFWGYLTSINGIKHRCQIQFIGNGLENTVGKLASSNVDRSVMCQSVVYHFGVEF